MKNLKVAKKLFISYGLILAMLILGCAVSVVDLVRLGQQTETFYDGPFTVKGSANIINSNFERMQKAVYRAISNSDPDIVNEAIANAKDSAAIIQEQIPVIRDHFLGDKQIIERLDDALTRLAPMRENVLRLASENKKSEAAGYMEENNILVIREAQLELDSLIENGNTKGEELIAGLRERQLKAILTLVILSSVCVAVSIVFGIYITRGITQPVKELEKAAYDMVRGEFSSVKIQYQSGDELGKLAADMRSMVSSLSDMIQDVTYLLNEMSNGNFNVHSNREDLYVGELRHIFMALRKINSGLSKTLFRISQSANEVAFGSEQTSSATQVLAQGATEQAASVEEVSGTISEISDQVHGNANSAKEASDRSEIVKSSAQRSSRYMKEMLDAMSNISEKSGEIVKIMSTIEDIAFQTNILALNAAVEAARAGEQGKGFTVVANEIRNLANQSSEASKNTAGLIESSLRAVEDGKRIANETAKAMAEAAAGIDNVSELLRHITDASSKQYDAVRQITESVGIISRVVQTNSATAEESAAASEELSSQAQLLSQLVNQFVLKEGIEKSL